MRRLANDAQTKLNSVLISEETDGADDIVHQAVADIILATISDDADEQLWNHDLNDWLTSDAGLTRCDAEPCLYYRHSDETGWMMLLTEIDDCLITGTDNERDSTGSRTSSS
jgi:hypothetical protein